MTHFLFYILFSCLLKFTLQLSTPEDTSYVAAVAEFAVTRNDFAGNLNSYVQFIQQASEQNVDIIAFPEMTLLNSTQSARVPIYGLLREYPIPALYSDLYDESLVRLSAAARQYQVYVVVNLREEMDCSDAPGEYCPEDKVYMFNTNVVFDRTGAVIDRYRKINLFGEYTNTPALRPDLGIFETDFGVTFGHFICFDLMFQVPAVQVVQKHKLTDIIFTTMWFSEMPYLTAVQIQEAYAYALNVNFIASGANNVAVGSAGSGIYSGKAGALVSIMPGVQTSRLLVARVPKVPGNVVDPSPGPIYDNPADHDQLVLISDPSLPSHVTRPLVQGFQEFTLVDKDVSCKFTVRLNLEGGETHYRYRAAAFSGVRSFSGVATGGSRVCSVVACTGDTIETCGTRFTSYAANKTAVFEELTIVGTVPTPVIDSLLDADNSVYFPLAMKTSIMPLEPEDFTYDKIVQDDVTVHTVTLSNFNVELYTFALWGRVFATDGLEADPPVDQIDFEDIITDVPGSSFVNVFNYFLILPLVGLMFR